MSKEESNFVWLYIVHGMNKLDLNSAIATRATLGNPKTYRLG